MAHCLPQEAGAIVAVLRILEPGRCLGRVRARRSRICLALALGGHLLGPKHTEKRVWVADSAVVRRRM